VKPLKGAVVLKDYEKRDKPKTASGQSRRARRKGAVPAKGSK